MTTERSFWETSSPSSRIMLIMSAMAARAFWGWVSLYSSDVSLGHNFISTWQGLQPGTLEEYFKHFVDKVVHLQVEQKETGADFAEDFQNGYEPLK